MIGLNRRKRLDALEHDRADGDGMAPSSSLNVALEATSAELKLPWR